MNQPASRSTPQSSCPQTPWGRLENAWWIPNHKTPGYRGNLASGSFVLGLYVAAIIICNLSLARLVDATSGPFPAVGLSVFWGLLLGQLLSIQYWKSTGPRLALKWILTLGGMAGLQFWAAHNLGGPASQWWTTFIFFVLSGQVVWWTLSRNNTKNPSHQLGYATYPEGQRKKGQFTIAEIMFTVIWMGLALQFIRALRVETVTTIKCAVWTGALAVLICLSRYALAQVADQIQILFWPNNPASGPQRPETTTSRTRSSSRWSVADSLGTLTILFGINLSIYLWLRCCFPSLGLDRINGLAITCIFAQGWQTIDLCVQRVVQFQRGQDLLLATVEPTSPSASA